MPLEITHNFQPHMLVWKDLLSHYYSLRVHSTQTSVDDMKLVRCPTKARKKCLFLRILRQIPDPVDPNAPLVLLHSNQGSFLLQCCPPAAPLARDPTYLGGVERSTKLPVRGDGQAGICERPKVMQLSTYSDI